MRVAIVLKTFPPDAIGGMETQTKKMATELQNSGHDVTVFTKQTRDHDDSDVDYDIIRIWNWKYNNLVSDLTFLILTLVALLRRPREFDVLQCMMIYPVGFLGYVINKIAGVPYFAWIRGGDYYLMNDVRWKRWMMRRVLSDTLVLAQSEEIKEDAVSDFDDIDADIEVLGNAVSIPNKTASGDGILYLGRLYPKKSVEYLIKAMDGLDVRLTIVGDGPERSRLEQLAERLDVDVTFVGSVPPDRVDHYYRNAEVFVLPSTEGEGMPNVVLEAMSWGLPVIATDSGGLRSMVDHGNTGYIVPMRDPDAISKYIQKLISNPELAKQIGQSARSHVEKNHSWEWLVTELDSIYADQVESKSR